MTHPTEPKCLSLVLCGGFYRDRTTRACSLIATFSHLQPSAFPTDSRFFVYFAVTELYRPTELTLRIVDSDLGWSNAAEAELFRATLHSDASDPLCVFDGSFLVRVSFPRPQLYHCELVVEGALLMSRRLQVHPAKNSV